jgi:hypothetical protein
MIELLFLLTTLVLGLFAGSLLTEAIILVPYWRRMDPADFLNLHASLGPNLFRFYAPLTTTAVILAVITGLMTGTDNLPWLITAGLCLAALTIFFIYFQAANNRFATNDIAEDELANELKNWSNWHWVRTILIIVALGTSIYGHTLIVVI